MGILEDAIREHLDLKRRHGAPEAELERQETEALGPARREVAPVQPADGDAELAQDELLASEEPTRLQAVPEPAAEAVDQAPAAAGEQPAPVEASPIVYDDRAEPAADASAADEPLGDAAAEESLEDASRAEGRPEDGTTHQEHGQAVPAAEEPVEQAPAAEEPTALRDAFGGDDPLADEADDEPEAEEGPGAFDDRPSSVDQPTEHFDVEEALRGDTPPRGFRAQEAEPESDAEEPEDGDVLEDTPDFLQDTPEHDRLWFEQKPPRDFDFD